MRSRLADLTETTTGVHPMALPALRAWQLEKLNATLALASTQSRFYRERLAGTAPLGCLEDIKHLPFTTENDLTAGLETFLCRPPDEVARVVTLPTSGSTGRPKRIGFAPADLDAIVDFFAAGMREMTGAGERVMICLPGTAEYGVPHLLAQGLERIGAIPIATGGIVDFSAAADQLITHRPQCIVGMPVQLLGLADHCAGQRPEAATTLQTALLTADYVPPSLFSRVARGLSCQPFNHYGSTEMGYGGAVECALHNGLHLRENDLYFEVVHPQTGAPLPPGQAGELVFTTLTRTAMPLIRYRTGDHARMLTDPCRCGFPLPRISPPYRKAGNALDLHGFELTLAALDDCVFEIDGLIDYRLTALADDTCLLEYWPGVEAAPQALEAQLWALPLLGRAELAGRLRIQRAEAGAPPPCTQGKRMLHTPK